MTTLRDLARHLGLSPATVSRALNGFPEVGQATRARVLAASEKFNYTPNVTAKRLATGKSGMVGLVFRTLPGYTIDPHFADFLASLSEALADSRIDLVFHVASVEDQLSHYRRFVKDGIVDGMILSAPEPNDARIALMESRNLPFVVHGRGSEDAGYAYFDIDNAGAFRAATTLLVELGHSRIAFLNGSERLGFARQRRGAYDAVLASRGLKTPQRFVVHGEMTEETGYAAAAAMLAEPVPQRPSAFICSSTLQALGVMRAAAEAGLAIGSELSIISHDDVLPHLRSENFAPPLTVTRAPIRNAGPALAQMIMARMDDVAPARLQRIEKADLIVRASTGRVPKWGEEAWTH